MRKYSEMMLRRAGVSVVTLSMVVAVFASPLNGSTTVSQAASKPKLESVKGTILTGESETVKIRNVKKKKIKKLTVTSSKKSVATAKKSGKTAFVVKSKKAGKATIKATVTLKNKKKYKLNYKATVADTVDRKVTIHRTDGKKSSIKLRYFADTPHVPYVRISSYFSNVTTGSKLKIKKTGADKYLLTNVYTESTASVNTKTDVLVSDGFDNFVMAYSLEDRTHTVGDGTEYKIFVQGSETVTTEEPKPVTISFKDYGIDLLGEKEDILIPFQTAATLFFSYGSNVMFYTGRDIYHLTDGDMMTDLTKTHYFRDIASDVYPDGKRPDDLVDYNYRELMFMLDNQWGNTDRCYFSDAIREKGMDRALSETDDKTRSVQALLKSKNLKDYQMGLGILNDMLYDGGHTALSIGMRWFLSSVYKDEYDSYYSDLSAAAERIGYKLEHSPDTYSDDLDSIKEYRKNINWDNHGYHEYGDTAVYTMDEMKTDYEAWTEFYKNGGEIPDDSFGGFIRSLNKASANKKIKNFVLDLTANGGGSDNIVAAMMGVMANDPNVYILMDKSGWKLATKYLVDKNLDGEYDEADDAVTYPFRFAVLTTECSFSCGNMLPFYMKSRGMMVLGQHTRGGARAAVWTGCGGDGLFAYVSTENAAVTWDGIDVDSGVEPDKLIEIGQGADGKPDYSAFYDIPALSGYINEFYDKK
ncbi:MAG: hypothetical protein J5819_02840 [Eubacterium sp.]|nr:hypothetical protein [Eubacterium sp.]